MALLRSIDMDLRRVYITPTGKRCKLQPGSDGYGGWFTFRYLDGTGESFSLTVCNLRILRLVP